MSAFEKLREELKNAPKPDYETLSHRLRPPREVPESNIKIQLNSMFAPGYAATYKAASQELMSRATELAIPILYLQRHSFELSVKDTIRMLLETREEMRVGFEVFGIEASPEVLDVDDWKRDWDRVHTQHRFEPLFECLTKNLRILELPEIPSDYHAAKDLIHQLDPGDGSLLRYATKGKTRTRSFDSSPVAEPKVARLTDLGNHLHAIETVHSRVSERGEEPASFIDHIYQHWCVGINYDIEATMRGLEKKTRAGELVWTLKATPPVGKAARLNVDLEPVCFAAEYEGRQLILADIAGSRNWDEFVACERDGELSRVAWLLEYQTNLYFAVKDAMAAKGQGMPW